MKKIFFGIILLIVVKNYSQNTDFRSLAIKSYNEKNYSDALIYVNREINIHSDDFFLYKVRGMCNEQLQNYDQAFEDYSKALDLLAITGSYDNQDGQELMIRIGCIYIKKDDNNSACFWLNKAIKLGNQKAKELSEDHCPDQDSPQLSEEYQEGSFQGEEEVQYNPTKEIFIINTCEYTLNEKIETLRRGYKVKVFKNKSLDFKEKQNNYLEIDYNKNTLTINLLDKKEIFTIHQTSAGGGYWGVHLNIML